jgi:hypothetical protein
MPYLSDFYIDKITNSIEEVATGKSFDTAILPVTSGEIKKVLKKEGGFFNWRAAYQQKRHQVYKLVLKEDHFIQGLISIEVMENYIEMHLLENAPHNYGPRKQYAGVAGNLVAFACKTGFELGFDGNVAFTAKTTLVEHYIETLGARLIYGRERMGIFTDAARKLVNSYYKNYFHGR